MAKNTPENFSKYICVSNGCHEWIGKIERSGYGRVSWYGKKRLAHRVAAYLHGIINDLETSDVVMHECDNKLCCNPKHLRAGTHSENTKDAIARGLHRLPDNRGVKSGNAKLTEKEVANIRKTYANEKVSQQKLAEQYGVCQRTISLVVRGVTYND